jgi:hypothetical protein
MAFSITARNAALAGVRTEIDSGSGPAVVKLFTGAVPSGPQAGESGTLVASIPLADPSFSTPSNGEMTANAISPTTAGVGGGSGVVISYGRLETSDGDVVAQLTVGGAGSGEDIELVNVNVAANQSIQINSFTIRQPE